VKKVCVIIIAENFKNNMALLDIVFLLVIEGI
jgi:hypothetical protein